MLGYKIYVSKSVFMGINITPVIKMEITMLEVAPWSSRIKYLGIELIDTMDFVSLLDLNLKPIIRSTEVQLGH